MYKIKINLLNIVEFFTVLFIILQCKSVYECVIGNPFHIKEIGLIVLTLLLVLNFYHKRVPFSLLLFYLERISLYYVFIIMFGLFRARANVDGYIIRFCLFFPMLILVLLIYSANKDISRLLAYYCLIMAIISAVSLFFWIFGSQLHLLSPNTTLLAHWGIDYYYQGYFYLHFERQAQQLWFFSGLRNHAFFTESPIFSLLLVIAIGIKLFLLPHYHIEFAKSDKKSPLFHSQTILFILALLSTVATTGIILLILELLVFYLFTKPKDKMMQIIRIVSGIIVVIAGLFLAWLVFDYKSTTTGSWDDRINGFTASINAFMLDPLFGNGYSDDSAVKDFYINGRGFTNALSTILYQGGLTLSVLILFPIFQYANLGIKKSEFYKTFFALLIFLELIFVTWAYTYLMFFLIAFFYAESRLNLISGIYKSKQRKVSSIKEI